MWKIIGINMTWDKNRKSWKVVYLHYMYTASVLKTREYWISDTVSFCLEFLVSPTFVNLIMFLKGKSDEISEEEKNLKNRNSNFNTMFHDNLWQ